MRLVLLPRASSHPRMREMPPHWFPSRAAAWDARPCSGRAAALFRSGRTAQTLRQLWDWAVIDGARLFALPCDRHAQAADAADAGAALLSVRT